MTSSNGKIFRVTGPLCGEFTGPGEFPTQRPVTQSFDVFFDLRPNKRLSKQPWGWLFETPSWSLWRQCNVPQRKRQSTAASLALCEEKLPDQQVFFTEFQQSINGFHVKLTSCTLRWMVQVTAVGSAGKSAIYFRFILFGDENIVLADKHDQDT